MLQSNSQTICRSGGFLDRAEVEQSSQRITLRYATALYMSSVLGSVILILPGWQPESRTRVSHCLGRPLACKLSTRLHFCKSLVKKARIGGVYSFAAKRSVKGWRPRLAGYSFYGIGWCSGRHRGSCILSCVCGSSQPNRNLSNRSIVACFGTFLINYRGIRVSGRVQMVVIVAITPVARPVVASLPRINRRILALLPAWNNPNRSCGGTDLLSYLATKTCPMLLKNSRIRA